MQKTTLLVHVTTFPTSNIREFFFPFCTKCNTVVCQPIDWLEQQQHCFILLLILKVPILSKFYFLIWFYISPKNSIWCSSERTRLPPMCPRFDSRTRRHMWIEFVIGSLPCSKGFSPGSPVFLPPQKPIFPNSNSIGNSRATCLSVEDCCVTPR